eukprot:s2682_g12.t1
MQAGHVGHEELVICVKTGGQIAQTTLATNVPTLFQPHTDHAELTPGDLTKTKGEDQTARQSSEQGLLDRVLTQDEKLEFTQKLCLLRQSKTAGVFFMFWCVLDGPKSQ